MHLMSKKWLIYCNPRYPTFDEEGQVASVVITYPHCPHAIVKRRWFTEEAKKYLDELFKEKPRENSANL